MNTKKFKSVAVAIETYKIIEKDSCRRRSVGWYANNLFSKTRSKEKKVSCMDHPAKVYILS